MRAPPDPSHPRLDAVLDRLAARNGAGAAVSLRDVLEESGSRAHGLAILVLALPEALPLPIPSAGAVLGVPLLLVSAHLLIHGERMRLPAAVTARRVPGPALDALARFAGPAIRRAERLTRPRLPSMVRRERLVGLAATLMSLVLFLPIPFVNLPPAIVLAILGWGLVQRDGLFVATGLALTPVLLGGSALLGGWAADWIAAWL
ncbi:exopolysaccharide biosynthesis protein [Jannaschia sp. W003]|uniref:exopolysaccharide biosynthesis protein n=1 Tax=Jannaschia sp. W003 TaxID=2867012 RepID=UPI0021A756AE|nr:exopolysaccharide biosynthesis protein [Jannaschia sp. W003]UWQ22418.1 exopolysaccharide biosynthesis protein [Jannaschia sp. W003]